MTQTGINYGKVLFELGVSNDVVAELQKVFLSSEELMDTLKNPVVSATSKRHIVDKIFGGGRYPDIVVNFLKKVSDNGHMDEISEIFDGYLACYYEANKIVTAKLYYVTEPQESQIEGFKNYLCNQYQANEARLELIQDESLMGGFILSVKNHEIDKSLKGRLKSMRQRLTRR